MSTTEVFLPTIPEAQKLNGFGSDLLSLRLLTRVRGRGILRTTSLCEVSPSVTINPGKVVAEESDQEMYRGAAKHVFLLGLLMAFVVLVLNACAGGGAGGGAQGKERAIPEKGPLFPGKYSTREFEPSFSLELGEGWRVWYPEETYSVELVEGEGNDKQLAFYSVQEVFQPHKEADEVYFEAKPAPDDMLAWFQRHPYVDTSEPKPANIDGIAGKRLGANFDVPKGYVDVYGGGCSTPCIPVFQMGGDLVIHALEGRTEGFIVLDEVEGKTVVVWISGPPDEFDEFLPKAQKVFDTVEWEGK